MSWPLVWGVFGLARSGAVQAAAVLDYGPPSAEKILGALPVLRHVLSRLDLAATIEAALPDPWGRRRRHRCDRPCSR
ncbi:hypothetical protein [Frankia sp. Cr2]|uniref:hypothetical protein n=1 Tax=Frankia sp. Cr2 TaxID=3073932 RepID=UPI002AD493CF|nr:hypothetical protein [Frankia sp. Cr2]